jgi:hypothetical protein
MKDEIAGTIYAKEYTDWHIKTGGFARDMTLRDHFAGLAMQGILMDEAITRDSDNSAKWIATIAAASYDMADAMLKERAK